jgi:Formate/nitrite family of transporters
MTVGKFFLNNLLPVTLGNIVGGVVFVALPLYLIYRNKNKAEA